VTKDWLPSIALPAIFAKQSTVHFAADDAKLKLVVLLMTMWLFLQNNMYSRVRGTECQSHRY
jgi:hypothetical protein